MEKITFEALPEAVTMLTKEVSELKRLIIEKQEIKLHTELSEQFLTIQEAAEFLNLSVPTIYSKVSKGELPVCKRGKRLYFSRNDLLTYVKDGRKKTNAEIAQEGKDFIANRKGLNNGK